MSDIKKLAGQTFWYGVPTIASRFLAYATNILLFWLYKPASTSFITQVYAIIPFLNILFTYGLETSYFRFLQTEDKKKLYNSLTVCLLFTTILFTGILFWQASAIANLVEMHEHPEYIQWVGWIMLFDTLAVLPFAKLRQENRPKYFALIKTINILINVLLTVFFLGICPKIIQHSQQVPAWLSWYNIDIGIGYYIIANIVASFVTLLLLLPQFKGFSFQLDKQLIKKVMNYSYPLIIVGLGGMINEMMSRVIYTKVVPLPREEALTQLGIFGANYKLAVLITIFIQVFKLGAEPFFFNQSKQANAAVTYARVMKFFVIACALMWLLIVVNLPLIKYLAYGKNANLYGQGLHIIPVLAMGSVFLGMYYNLTVWYKLTNQTLIGAYITLAGAAITIALNIWWIPIFGYTGSAWATFICYAFMMVVSYLLGQKYYPIPYDIVTIFEYLAVAYCLFFSHGLIVNLLLQANLLVSSIIGAFISILFLIFIFFKEKKELQQVPFFSKWLK